jgi:putative transcriptional regulator
MKNNPKLTKLREARQKKGLTIKYMANSLGISPSMYGYIENGDKRLSYDMAVAIADFFETTPDDLFYEDYEQFFKDVII